ncbi:metal-dependent hydrolase [Halorhabdus sp. CUG00001]|uniref:metal-dependent hydrolase n=1 Tax=Halorhabdus sp. CUG00001 TaxID=2600297 RepID=UPI00131AA687|nr:metal-dependent hydrolase [Halorhabdus sp. CUG00001]
MFVGHAFLAFGIVALIAGRYGPETRPLGLPGGVTVGSAVAVGLAAALFSSLPDVDVAHAAFQVVTLPEESTAFDHFWAATSERHRTTTHSLVVAVAASVGFALWPVGRWLGLGVLAGVVALGAVAGGIVGGAVMTVFVLVGLLVVTLALKTGLAGRSIFTAAVVGLSIHPFTDLLTGEPPLFFAPWEFDVIGGRIEPFVDPTLNLLLAFGTELAVIWFGLLVGLWLAGIDCRRHVHAAATVGIAYAPMALVLRQPSVDNATPFVATILLVGVVGVVSFRRPLSSDTTVTAALTALATITFAWLGFTLAYVTVTGPV